MVKTFNIKIDIEKDIYSPMQIQFEVSNSDDSVELNFEFIQDENPFDLTGSTVQLAVSNPSNQVFYQDIDVVTPVEGKASVQLSNQGFQQVGLHVSEIYIRDVDTIVTSPFYFKSRPSIIQAEIVPTDPTGDGTITWANVLNKPSSFPPEIHSHLISDVTGLQLALDSKANVGETGGAINLPIGISDVTNLETVLGSKADINHTHPEYLTSVPPEYLTSIPAEYLTETEGDLKYQASGSIPVHDHPEYLTSVPLEYLTQTEGDTRYQASGSYLTDIPAEYLTEIEGDARYQASGSIPAHDHVVGDVTGLQLALDGKMDDGDAYLKTETYSKADVYNRTEIDQMTMGEGGGSPVIVEDNLMSNSTSNALSSNQGRILDETKSDINHTHIEYAPTLHSHAIGDVTGLSLELDSKSDVNHTHPEYADAGHTHPEYLTSIPAEYLTQTEGDLLYQPTGSIPAHDHPEYLTSIPAEYLTQTEGDALYQPSGSYLTSVPLEYLTETEGDLKYQASGSIPVHDHPEYADAGHTHPEYLTSVPLEYLTQTEGDTRYQASGSYLTDIPAEYLTQTEGDLLYQPTGSIPEHTHPEYADAGHTHPEYLTSVPAEYLTETEGDTKYQVKGSYLTSIPAEYLTQTEGDLLYQPTGSIPVHDHPEYLTSVPLEYLTETEGDLKYQASGSYLTSIPAEYLTQTEGDALYQPIGAEVPVHSHAISDVTGLQTALDSKITSTYADAGDNYIMNTRMAGLTLWKGTQAEYDLLTPNSNTLYFIVG